MCFEDARRRSRHGRFIFNSSASFTPYSRNFIVHFRRVSTECIPWTFGSIVHRNWSLSRPGRRRFRLFRSTCGATRATRELRWYRRASKDAYRGILSAAATRGAILSHHYRDRHRRRTVYDSQRIPANDFRVTLAFPAISLSDRIRPRRARLRRSITDY